MAAWDELLREFNATPAHLRANWLNDKLTATLADLAHIRNDRNVVVYASAFLQKPQAPSNFVSITMEDVNGFMSVIHGMDFDKPLTIVLHTPGGATNATETIVEYLRTKFDDIEVIVPLYAMSAGTMISLAANRLVMGRQSQLGPIDPQLPMGGRFISARAVQEQFETARNEILNDVTMAHVWAPILSSLGPSLLVEATNALAYSENMVCEWLAKYMLAGKPKAVAQATASHFNNATHHKSHGRRIDRADARANNVVVEDMEGPGRQQLQETVLTLYHLLTITFEQSPAAKVIMRDGQHQWVKNWLPPELQQMLLRQQMGDPAVPTFIPGSPGGAGGPGAPSGPGGPVFVPDGPGGPRFTPGTPPTADPAAPVQPAPHPTTPAGQPDPPAEPQARMHQKAE